MYLCVAYLTQYDIKIQTVVLNAICGFSVITTIRHVSANKAR